MSNICRRCICDPCICHIDTSGVVYMDKPNTAGDGYRLLAAHEIVQHGDEVWQLRQRWGPVSRSVGYEAGPRCYYRRRRQHG